MSASIKQFAYYVSESFNEFKNNLKIYLIYAFSLCLVSIIQNGFDLIFTKNEMMLRIASKILFSVIPILIFSKILYVIKIRRSGLGEYGEVLWKFMLYNFYYFFLVAASASLYFILVIILSAFIGMQLSFFASTFMLAPMIYVMIFFSISPFVAVFDDESSNEVFARSKKISNRNISLVIINHLSSLLVPIIFSSLILIENPVLKLSVAILSSVPESIFSILMILTTARIYQHLIDRE